MKYTIINNKSKSILGQYVFKMKICNEEYISEKTMWWSFDIKDIEKEIKEHENNIQKQN